jgi:hypothetical protein
MIVPNPHIRPNGKRSTVFVASRTERRIAGSQIPFHLRVAECGQHFARRHLESFWLDPKNNVARVPVL